MADWTPSQIEDRLTEAADVLHRLPDQGVRGYFTTWPEVVHSTTDGIGREPAGMSRPRPSPAAISCMEEALDWLRFLEADDAKLVWARAEGRRWKAICWRFGISRATAHRRWQYGLSVIALRLNKRRVSAKRSMAFAVGEARGCQGMGEA